MKSFLCLGRKVSSRIYCISGASGTFWRRELGLGPELKADIDRCPLEGSQMWLWEGFWMRWRTLKSGTVTLLLVGRHTDTVLNLATAVIRWRLCVGFSSSSLLIFNVNSPCLLHMVVGCQGLLWDPYPWLSSTSLSWFHTAPRLSFHAALLFSFCPQRGQGSSVLCLWIHLLLPPLWPSSFWNPVSDLWPLLPVPSALSVCYAQFYMFIKNKTPRILESSIFNWFQETFKH